MHIDDLLRIAMERKASDLHLKVGNYPHVRVDGELVPLTEQPRVSAEDMLNMAFSMMSNRQKQKFKEVAELDMAYGVAGLGRFRVNVFQQRGNVGLVLRVIPTKIRALEELYLPKVIEHICEEARGLVLVTGVTGSGKSTTLAAMLDRINSSRSEHIITIEDPIEFLHRDKKGFVNQREVEVDTPSFGSALRASLRQDPDVILVGEMRDLETISTALHAAETGHLVFSTLHTLDAVETINRIISVFPPPEQKQVRMQLGATLRAVVSQRLVKRADGAGRVPATEVLISTAFVRECIMTPEKTRLLHEAIGAGSTVCRRLTSPSTICTRKAWSAMKPPWTTPAIQTTSSSKCKASIPQRTRHASRWSKPDLAPEEHKSSAYKQPPKRNTQRRRARSVSFIFVAMF
jgi:twitching motility protein PilT